LGRDVSSNICRKLEKSYEIAHSVIFGLRSPGRGFCGR
jgi:hypothetical protein